MIHVLNKTDMVHNLQNTKGNHSDNMDLEDTDTALQNMEPSLPDNDKYLHDPPGYSH